MIDGSFAKWWLARVGPFRDVPPEKLLAEREAMARQQEYNRNYADFLNDAVLPAVDDAGRACSRAADHPPRQHLGQSAFAARAPGVAVGRAGHHAEPRGLRHLRASHHHRRRKTRRRLGRRSFHTSTTCATRCPRRWPSRSCSSSSLAWRRICMKPSRRRRFHRGKDVRRMINAQAPMTNVVKPQ